MIFYLRYVDNSIIIDALNELIKRDFNVVRLGRSKRVSLKIITFIFCFKYKSIMKLPHLFSNSI